VRAALALLGLAACSKVETGPPRGAEASGLAVWYRDRGRLAEALTCAFDGDDLEELADTYAALGMSDAELEVRARLLSRDPASLFNLAAALRERGDATAPLFREILFRISPDDVLFPLVLEVVADDCGNPDESARLYAQLEDPSCR